MKEFLTTMLSVLMLLFALGSTVLAQDPVLPTDNGEMNIAFFTGFGEEYWKFVRKDDPNNFTEIDQSKTVFGFNWVHNFGFGVYHARIGYESWGNTIIDPSGGDPVTETDWRAYQDWSIVFGAGYMYLTSVPISNAPGGSTAFFGGGCDFMLSSGNTDIPKGPGDYDEITHNQYVFSFIGTGGINITEVGIIISATLGLNLLVDWEERKEKWKDGDLNKVDYRSDDWDLEIPIFTLGLAVSYTLPMEPRLRFGINAQFVNAFYFTFQVGYTFGLPVTDTPADM